MLSCLKIPNRKVARSRSIGTIERCVLPHPDHFLRRIFTSMRWVAFVFNHRWSCTANATCSHRITCNRDNSIIHVIWICIRFYTPMKEAHIKNHHGEEYYRFLKNYQWNTIMVCFNFLNTFKVLISFWLVGLFFLFVFLAIVLCYIYKHTQTGKITRGNQEKCKICKM